MNEVGIFFARCCQLRQRLKVYLESCNRQAETIFLLFKGPRGSSGADIHADMAYFLLTLHPEVVNTCRRQDNQWIFVNAVYMPGLNHDLKMIIAVPFQLASYIRLGTLQAQVRQQGW